MAGPPEPSVLYSAVMKQTLSLTLSQRSAVVYRCLAGPVAWLLLASSVPAATPVEEIRRALQPELPSLEALYKELHAQPELSFQEARTSARIASELERLGYRVTTRVGGYGVVAVLANGPGPVVLIRTDMDALPVEEQTGAAYASRARARDDQGRDVPVMHACGHDMHMACFVGTARVLARLRSMWSGTLVLVAQPAEERGAGARRMLEDGLYERFPRPQFALALHASPDLAAGQIGYVAGFALANVDSVDITIRGIGGHGSRPEDALDPIVLAAEMVLALQTIVSREISPFDPAVVTVGSIHGGTKHNIIPDRVDLQLTVRSYRDEVRQHILQSIRRIALGIAEAAGVPRQLEPLVRVAEDEYTPAVYNDPALTERLVTAWKRVLGEGAVVQVRPVMGGEDFSRYGRVDPPVPSCLFWLGTVDPIKLEEARAGQRRLPSLHSPQFLPAIHPTLETGVVAMVTAAMELLAPATQVQ